MNEGAGQHDEDDDGDCDSQRCLDVEELAVEDEACQPEGEVQPVYAFFAVVLLQAGMGLVGILIVLLSTVTTTFLDAFSAGVSGKTLISGLSEKALALFACAGGIGR